MSVGDTISEKLDLQKLNQGATGIQVTILQDGTVDSYPSRDRRQVIIQQKHGVLVGDPHGITSLDELEVFQVGVADLRESGSFPTSP